MCSIHKEYIKIDDWKKISVVYVKTILVTKLNTSSACIINHNS